MAGRGVQHQQQLGTGSVRQFGCTRFPDVGTDVNTATDIAEGHDTGFTTCVEITLFVKNFVVGEANLAVNRSFLAIFNDRCRVVTTAFMLLRISDNQGNAHNPARQIIQRPLAGPIKIRAQQQVFRRVAA